MSDRPVQSTQDNLRIPFYQEENSGRDFNLDSSFGQMFCNLIPERLSEANTYSPTMEQQLSKRQGLTAIGLNYLTGIVNSPTSCIVHDLICITALYDVFIAAVFDTSNSTFYVIQIRPTAGTAVKIGSLFTSNANDYMFLTEISQASGGNTVPALAVSYTKQDLSSGIGFYAISSGGVFPVTSMAVITDVNFPANQTPALIPVGRFVWLNAITYIATANGQIFNSTSNGSDITAWENSTGQIGVIAAQAYPDQLVGLCRYKQHIVAFGTDSIEFFDDIGDTPTPLTPISQAFIKFGAESARCIINVDDVLYWIGKGAAGERGLWTMDGYTPTKLSTPYIDNQIVAENPSAYNFKLASCVLNGKRQVFINSVSLPTMNTVVSGALYSNTDTYQINALTGQPGSIVYNVEDKTWWGVQWIGDRNATAIFATYYATPNSGVTSTQLALTTGTGLQVPSVYKLRTDGVFADDITGPFGPSTPVCALAQMNPVWFANANRKRVSRFKIITNTMPFQATGDASVYALYLVYTRDNQVSFVSGVLNNAVVRRLAYPGTIPRIYFNNLGMGRLWNFMIIDNSKMNLRLKSVELDVQQGSH